MCVIFFTKVNGKNILFKNRDRQYKASVQIVHEIRNGTEIVYIHDTETGWIEGINEHGIGIISSTFGKTKTVKNDKKSKINYMYHDNSYVDKLLYWNNDDDPDDDSDPDDDDSNVNDETVKVSDLIKGQQILNGLTGANISSVIQKILKPIKKKSYLEGHTIVCSNKKCFHIEHKKQRKNMKNSVPYIINEIENKEVFTNHGTYFSEEGCTSGVKGLSSMLRKIIARNELETCKVENEEQLFQLMNKNYRNVNPLFHVYRDGTETLLQKIIRLSGIISPHPITKTLSQMLLNLNEKELIYKYDAEHSIFFGIKNMLPTFYIPRVKIRVNQTFKTDKIVDVTLEPKVIQYLYNKYSYTYKDSILLNKLFLSVVFLTLLLILFLIRNNYSRFLKKKLK